MNFNYIMKEIIKAFSSTPEFVSLKQAQYMLSETPQAASLVSQFSKKQESLYSGGLAPNKAQYIMDELSKEYESLSRIPEIKNYFEASERFSILVNRFMQDLNNSLTKELQ